MATPIQKTATSWEYIILRDTNNDILLMQGTTVPTTTTTGFAKWCTFLDTDVVGGTSGVYFNKGTNTSCEFELAPVASTGTFTDITATWNTVLGDAVSDTTTIKGATSIQTSSASGLVVGLNWATNPVLKVNASTATQATWVQITWAAAAGWVAIDVVSSWANENLTVDAKGTGTITIAGTSTWAVTITPATTITGAITAWSTIGAAWSITLGAGADLIGSATSDITINTDKFTVAWDTWNTLVAWTFEATGASTLTGAVGCAASITLGAGADLIGSSTSDITINTDKFTVAWATWNTVIAWTATVTWLVTLTAGITGKVILESVETIAAGWTTTALDLTKTRHDIDSDAGWDIFTLADWVDGQLMIVVNKSATGISTVTPATFLSGTSVTMATAGASVMLMFQTTNWWSVLGWNAYTVI